ncbi:hypothetical protein V8F20_001602 [Naviculisporaceae sp. PSN 640]
MDSISLCSTAVESQYGPVEGTPGPALTKIPEEVDYGYRPFPPSMNLYMDASKNCMKLCGPTKNDVIYFVEYHLAKTLGGRGSRSLINGLLLLDGPPNKHNTNSAIVAGTGDDPDSQIITTDGSSKKVPHSLSEICRRSVIVMPPLKPNKGNCHQEMVEKIMYASTTPSSLTHFQYFGSLCFRFFVEIGVHEPRPRAEFEWDSDAASEKLKEKRAHFVLLRVPGPTVSPPSAAAALSKDPQVLAELMFSSAWSRDHLMTLNLKGAALTGKLGDRWTLMVVMTALRINYLRREGRTNKLKNTLVQVRNTLSGKNRNTIWNWYI